MSFQTLFRSILPSQNGHGDKLPPHVASVEDFAGLTRILEPAINLAILPRRMPDAFAYWLNDLPYDELPDGRTLLEGIDEQQLISRHVASNLQAPHPAAACLVDDILEIVTAFRQISGYDTLQLRLERIDHHACKKFHMDNVGLRLLVTYRGAGTEWLPEQAVDRNAPDCCEEHSLCKNPYAIQKLPRGHIGIFKGSAYAPGVTSGIVHRSPPIAGRKQSRLLLCLDEPYY